MPKTTKKEGVSFRLSFHNILNINNLQSVKKPQFYTENNKSP
jgi:hypothetical protein